MADLRLAIFTGNYNHIKDGVSLTLNRLVQFLNEKGISVIVFGPSVENPVLNHAGTFVEVPSISIPGRSEYRLSLGLSPKAQRILEDFSPNLVQISTPDLLGYQAFKWAKANRVARVASYHTHFTSYLHYYYLDLLEEFGWKFMRWLYGQCSHVYVPTLSMAEELEKHGIEKGLRIWSRGVDLNKFSPEKRNGVWRKEHGFEKDDIIVSYVSRLVWEKEPMTFARSVELAARSNPKIKPMVVGEGPAYGDLKELLPSAHFLGFLTGKELADAYANSDIFAFPSLSETFGNVTLEAMASGLPCVVADAAGSKSLIVNNANGYIVQPRSVLDFAKKIELLAQDTTLRKSMGDKSRELAKKYDWDSINELLLQQYLQVINP